MKEASTSHEFSEKHRNRLYALDRQVTEILLGAENQCSKKRPLRNLWSPALQKAGKEIVYWKRRISTNGHMDEGTKDLSTHLNLPATIQQSIDISLCYFYLNVARQTYRGIQKHAQEHRDTFLKCRAKEQAAQGNGVVEHAIKQIRKRERLKQDYASIQRASGANKQGLSTLDTPTPNNSGRTLITDATQIHQLLPLEIVVKELHC